MLTIMQYAARKAGNLLMQYFHKNVVTSYKSSSHQNLVTEVDELSQRIIYETISHSLKLHGIKDDQIGFIGEEEQLRKQGKHLFVIDPIDGTTNYLSGIDYFGISIAYFLDRNLQIGVINDPVRDTLYYAEKGKGTYKVGGNKHTKLSVKYLNFKKSLIVTHLSNKYKNLRKDITEFTLKIFPLVKGVRELNCTVLDYCHVADNVFQSVIYPSDSIWDFSAAKLIVEEADGVFTDWKGKEIVFDFDDLEKRYKLIACHKSNLKNYLQYLK